ncbi:hypothetical protein JDV09_12505 [Mycobacterium sp. Y57]|uniref:hypothetical protein n=1 Tax=Mycolicibacterium xanthum TaxID=2796469 RepID=UPI001C84A6E6|nr:hypothetical protein [Mycolicibacterium xanthum]MBX7432922.1 hypothetical protein [Mycolicibacterium xanthum]
MVTLPAVVWRGGGVRRALTIGAVSGLTVGVLAWLDSGFVVGGLIVAVIVGGCFGLLMSRRMTRYWPGSARLSAAQRVAVVRAARRGERVPDARLSASVAECARGLHEAADDARPLRWLLLVVLVVAVAAAGWDAVFGSWGDLVASGIYLTALAAELLWWPGRQRRLLANADLAASPG